MKNPRMQFETIPVYMAKNAAENSQNNSRFASCAICRQPIELEHCKTDEDGSAVHENCYIEKVGENNKPEGKRAS
jgi:hypothetical protein